jgi:chemotaxis protein MotB
MQRAVVDAIRALAARFDCGLALCLLLPIAFGCVTKGTYDAVVSERDQLAAARKDLENRVEQLTAANQSLTTERVALIDENEDLRIAKESNEREVEKLTRVKSTLTERVESSEAALAARNAEIEKMRSSYDGLVEDLESEVAAGQIQIERLRSGLKLNLSEDILFPSGSATLNAQGKAVLSKVSHRLVGLSNNIEIVGHTDNVPVARRYPSNWELAAARASSVARLMTELGVAPERIKVVSRAEFDPIASNDTAEGRAKNRRIEILLDAPIEESDGASTAESGSAGAGSNAPAADSSAPAATEPAAPPAS